MAEKQCNLLKNGGGMSKYSTSEVLTGDTWIDGKPIYLKVIDWGTIPSGAFSGLWKSTVESYYDHVHVMACWTESNGNVKCIMPYFIPDNVNASIGYKIERNSGKIDMYLFAAMDRSNFGNVMMIIEYTKT